MTFKQKPRSGNYDNFKGLVEEELRQLVIGERKVQPRIPVFKNGAWWCVILESTPEEIDAMGRLERAGVIKTMVTLYKGRPRHHVRLCAAHGKEFLPEEFTLDDLLGGGKQRWPG
jgi:hypothetical protein